MVHLSRRKYILLGGSVLLVAGLALAASLRLNGHDPVTLPNETAIHITLNQTLASDQSRPGDHFEATISEPIVVADKTVIPQGAPVEGLVIDAHHSGRLMGRARLQIALQTVTVHGEIYDLQTASRTMVGGKHKKRNLWLIGGGAGGGALVGAIAAGGKGVLIGGPIGAGVGTAAALITGKKDVRLPAETSLTFRLTEPVTINAKG
jgi:hypothetical protein